MSLDRAVDLPRSRGPRTTRSGAYVEDENIASGAKTKRGRLNPTDLRCSSNCFALKHCGVSDIFRTSTETVRVDCAQDIQ